MAENNSTEQRDVYNVITVLIRASADVLKPIGPDIVNVHSAAYSQAMSTLALAMIGQERNQIEAERNQLIKAQNEILNLIANHLRNIS